MGSDLQYLLFSHRVRDEEKGGNIDKLVKDERKK